MGSPLRRGAFCCWGADLEFMGYLKGWSGHTLLIYLLFRVMLSLDFRYYIGCLCLTAFLAACSNSECLECVAEQMVAANSQSEMASKQVLRPSYAITSCSAYEDLKEDCLPVEETLLFNDSLYPYVGLPRIVIRTENNKGVETRKNFVNAKFQIFGQSNPESKVYDMMIRGRGNTTWLFYPKKPYAIKFNEKVSLFGLPKAKKWVLLANYRERTLMRNALALKVASDTDLKWNPKGVFVELFLNEKFLGNYYLCEKIEVKKNRLNIDKESYLLEFDTNYDEEYKFKTKIKKYPVNIKNPENPTDASFEYIRNYIDTVESIIYKGKWDLDIEDYIDFNSFADYFIVYNVSQNYEINHPKSVFMYKEPNKKLKVGPVWDFDYMTFKPTKLGLCCVGSLWYDKLRKNQNFISILKKKWNSYKKEFLKNDVFIDSIADYIRESNERNLSLWPIDIDGDSIGDEELDFDDAIEMLKNAYKDQISELDLEINGL